MQQMRGHAAVAALVSLGLLALAGCGGDESGLPPRYSVSGYVKYKGEPVEKGTIVFEPNDVAAGRVAQGTIENGYYKLTTSGEGGDGALPGDYKVVVMSKVVDMNAVEANRKGGAGRQDDVYKAEQKAERKVPKKYERSDTSKLTAKVEAHSNSFNFDLTDD
jgi:hypothetical protein